jgi:uncharacterized membrane protein YgaE (UPF0421/DUF939 family)
MAVRAFEPQDSSATPALTVIDGVVSSRRERRHHHHRAITLASAAVLAPFLAAVALLVFGR